MAGWYSKRRNNPLRLLSYVLIAFIVILVVMSVLSTMADGGIMIDIWGQVLAVIPFGNLAAQITVSIYGELVDATVNANEYLMTAVSSWSWFVENICKLCLTAMLFGSVSNFLQNLTGLKDAKGFWVALQRIVADIISAVLSAFFAGIVLGIFFEQLRKLAEGIQGVLSAVITLGILGASVWVFRLLLGIGIGSAVLYVLIKLLLMNVVKLMLTYVLALFLLLCLAEKAYLYLGVGFGTWGALILMVIGIEMCLESVSDWKL